MTVSVVVSAYNVADILPITLPSLLAQDFSGDLQIVLVDDASMDGTAETMKRIAGSRAITVVRHESNRGRSATRNSGIAAAKGELVILLDSDIEVATDFVSSHVACHVDPRVIGLVSTPMSATPARREKFHRYIFESRRGASQCPPDLPLPFRYFVMTAASIKASALRQAGPFNERLKGYGIDLEFAYRLWRLYPEGLFRDPHISVKVHKIKTVDEAMQNFSDFGRRNLPVILNQFPELASVVGADFVWRRGQKTIKSLAGSVAIRRTALRIVRSFLPLAPFPLSSFLIRFLLAGSTVVGYREGSRRGRD